MKVAHLVSFFNTNKLYGYLLLALDELGIVQEVLSPRKITNSPENTKNIVVQSTTLWSKWHRFFFSRKIIKYCQWLQPHIDSKSPDVLHAHTLYSDGFAAYEVHRINNVPYVVTVRSTDLNTFAKYVWFLKPKAVRVIENAAHVIFVNHVTKKKLENYLKTIIPETKVSVIPNGLPEYWKKSSVVSNTFETRNVINVICVAKVSKNKNQESLIKATLDINTKLKSRIILTLVGDYSSRYAQRIKRRYEGKFVRFLGVLSHEQIRREYQNHNVFALVSHTETFGVVYLEALSQGLPVLYTVNQGFHGWDLNNKWGSACNPKDISEISRGIIDLAEIGRLGDQEVSKIKSRFDWSNIAKDVQSAYRVAIINNEKDQSSLEVVQVCENTA